MSIMTPFDWPAQILLHLGAKMTDDEFFRFCDLNGNFRFERTSSGDLVIMTPTGGGSGHRNAKLTSRIDAWAEREGSGLVFDSSTQFKLPNGAIRSPDTSWILNSRWETLPEEDRERVAEIVPDFAADLRSPSDSLRGLQEKMLEYMEVGVRLGLLIDPHQKVAYLYRPGQDVERIDDPNTIDLSPELPGCKLKMRGIW